MKDHEVEQCVDVIRQGFGTVASDFGLTVENCPTNGAFMNTDRLKADINKGKLMYVLCEADKIVGFMELEKIDSNKFELQKITVLPKFRHHGYGREMLDFAKEKVAELGGSYITIGIIEENTTLKEWYIKNGFIHNGTHVFNHLPFTVGYLFYEIKNN
jgi:ribosomal protein S18 acetylase RimI-like enzyme